MGEKWGLLMLYQKLTIPFKWLNQIGKLKEHVMCVENKGTLFVGYNSICNNQRNQKNV